MVGGVSQFFRYAIDRRYLPVLLPFLLRPSRDGVTLTDDGLFVGQSKEFLKLLRTLAEDADAAVRKC